MSGSSELRAGQGSRPVRGASLRRHGYSGADGSGERMNSASGRRVGSFRLSGRRYADMPGVRRADSASSAEKKLRYLVFWKPYGVDVRFTGGHSESELDYYVDVPGVLPVNFLDKEAEGLMILTNDPKFRAILTNPLCSELRTFLAQTENIPDEEAVKAFHAGVMLSDNGVVSSIEAEVIPAPKLPSRPVPIRERKSIPTAWVELRSLSGASRGIRKVSAGLGYPVLRLLLWGFGPVSLTGMVPGQCRDLRYEEMRWVESQLENASDPLTRRRFAQASSSRRPYAERGAQARRGRPSRKSGGRRFACAAPESAREVRSSYPAEGGSRRQNSRGRVRNSAGDGDVSSSCQRSSRPSFRHYGEARSHYAGNTGRSAAAPAGSRMRVRRGRPGGMHGR